jgi:hypothetical protein
MGYRSDVAYAIRFKNKEHRIRFMAAQAIDVWIKLEDFSLIDDETVMLSYEHVKWYPEYEDVIAHTRLLDEAKEQGCAWEFCRIGEDFGDVVCDGDDGKDDEGDDIDAPDIVEPSQSIYISNEGEAYPIGESLTTTL